MYTHIYRHTDCKSGEITFYFPLHTNTARFTNSIKIQKARIFFDEYPNTNLLFLCLPFLSTQCSRLKAKRLGLSPNFHWISPAIIWKRRRLLCNFPLRCVCHFTQSMVTFKLTASQENKSQYHQAPTKLVWNRKSGSLQGMKPTEEQLQFFQQVVKVKKPMVLQCCLSLKSRQSSFLLYKLKQASAVMLIWKRSDYPAEHAKGEREVVPCTPRGCGSTPTGCGDEAEDFGSKHLLNSFLSGLLLGSQLKSQTGESSQRKTALFSSL